MKKTIFNYAAVGVGVVLFLASAVYKLVDPAIRAQLAGGGFSIYVLMALQMAILALYVWPRTFRLGFFLVCCYMGGAIAYSFGESAAFAIVTTVALWVGAYVRDPAFFFPKRNGKKTDNTIAVSN